MRNSVIRAIAISSLIASTAIAGRINLGTNPGMFFDDAGFTAGDTSFARTVSIDGNPIDVLVEGFDAVGAASGLFPNAQALGVGDSLLDTDETIKFTFTNLPGDTTLSSVGVAAFDPGDTYEIEVMPGGVTVGSGVTTPIGMPISEGAMATMTATTGSIRGLWLSMSVVPEPGSLSLAAFGLLFFVRQLRRRQ